LLRFPEEPPASKKGDGLPEFGMEMGSIPTLFFPLLVKKAVKPDTRNGDVRGFVGSGVAEDAAPPPTTFKSSSLTAMDVSALLAAVVLRPGPSLFENRMETVTFPPRGVNLRAFDIRFRITW
jgi:hypothetical protein